MTVLHGDGQLYWNGGMRHAFAAAIAGDYDYYLWMYDDTVLDDRGLATLVDELRAERSARQAVSFIGTTMTTNPTTTAMRTPLENIPDMLNS